MYITGLLEIVYNFEEKANRKMDEEKRHTTWKQQIIVHHRQRGREEEKEGRSGRVGRVGGRRKRQGMGGAQSREKDEGCTFIYYTHSMTDLHAIVVNSFVF